MITYINIRITGETETVDEAPTKREASAKLKEYRKASDYYATRRTCRPGPRENGIGR